MRFTHRVALVAATVIGPLGGREIVERVFDIGNRPLGPTYS